MSDRTPADTWVPTDFDVWFHDHLVEDWGHDDVLAWDVARDFAQRLGAGGFRVTPIPDDNTRALAARLNEWADEIEDQHRPEIDRYADDLRAAVAYLDGQPQDRPDRCPTCGSDDREVRHCLPGDDEQGWPIDCSHAWHVGGSGDTR